MHIFAKAFPDRYFQMGMAEQLLFGAAAGMAETGLMPFASTYSVFAARRAYDFICLDIAEPGLNVNIVGGLPGLTTGYGPSHQATEDIAIFRGMPGLTIVDPCDSVDIEQAVPQLAEHPGPTYLRLLRGQVPTVLDEYDYTFELGKAKVLRAGADVVLISQRPDDDARAAGGRGTGRTTSTSPSCTPRRSSRSTRKPCSREVDTDRLVRHAGEPHRRRRAVRDRGLGGRAARGRQADHADRACPTSFSPPARCRRCTTATACRRRGSSPPCSDGCNDQLSTANC